MVVTNALATGQVYGFWVMCFPPFIFLQSQHFTLGVHKNTMHLTLHLLFQSQLILIPASGLFVIDPVLLSLPNAAPSNAAHVVLPLQPQPYFIATS